MNLPKHLQQILWDVDPNTINLNRHRIFIITRVAEKGTWADIQWLKKQYGIRSIKKAVSDSRNTSLKTKSFWKII